MGCETACYRFLSGKSHDWQSSLLISIFDIWQSGYTKSGLLFFSNRFITQSHLNTRPCLSYLLPAVKLNDFFLCFYDFSLQFYVYVALFYHSLVIDLVILIILCF